MEEKNKVKKMIESLLSLDLTEDQEAHVSIELDKICPDPEWSRYIFWTDDFSDKDGNFDIDAVVEKIFSYKPIILPDQSE